ncbi:unnamed protein product, partial [Mesorhabditis spiculigera]
MLSSTTAPLLPTLEAQKINHFHCGRETFIIVVVVENSRNSEEYEFALGSISCYANLQGYAMQVLNLAEEPSLAQKCPQKDFMFRRHCALAEFLAASQYGWALFLDADIGVVNPLHRLENYTLTEDLHLVFYNRFYNDEVASGSYIVRNTQRGLGFLHFWANYYQEHPYFGTDNGAINNVIVDYFHPELYESRQVCEAIWAASKNYEGLFNYQACVQEYILSVATSTEYHIYEKRPEDEFSVNAVGVADQEEEDALNETQDSPMDNERANHHREHLTTREATIPEVATPSPSPSDLPQNDTLTASSPALGHFICACIACAFNLFRL